MKDAFPFYAENDYLELLPNIIFAVIFILVLSFIAFIWIDYFYNAKLKKEMCNENELTYDGDNSCLKYIEYDAVEKYNIIWDSEDGRYKLNINPTTE